MGQIVSSAAKPKRCNLQSLSSLETPAAGEHILVSSDNSMNAAGQGNFDCYIEGDGTKAATALELKWIADKELAKNSKNAISNSAVYEEFDIVNNRISEIGGGSKSVTDYHDVAQGGQITFNAITLSQDGDELYIEALPLSSIVQQNSGGYGFTFQSENANKVVVGLALSTCCVRSDDNTWIASASTATGNSDAVTPKRMLIKYTGGNIEVYTNGNLRTTYTGQKVITIDGIGGNQSIINQRWGGKIWHFQYTHNGVTKELEELDGYSHDANVSVVTRTIETIGRLTELEGNVEQLAEDMAGVTDNVPYIEKVKALGWSAKLKGNANSILTAKTPIALSSDGDSLEIVFDEIVSSSFQNGGYAFTRTPAHETSSGVDGLFVADKFAARSDDKTWLVTVADNITMGRKLLISYESGKILFYIDDVLKKTYSGQKAITINSFGDGAHAEYGYWAGGIKSIKLNGTALDLINDFVWGTDVEMYRDNGFLTDEQAESIASSSVLPNNVVTASADLVNVYTKIYGNLYAGIDIKHAVYHADEDYSDYWRINNTGHFYQWDGSSFVPVGGALYVGAENEFAIKFANTSDFSGGYHGDERIDLDTGCYVMFLVDGKEYTISQLIALGRVECGTFAYREKAIIYSEYATTSAHDRWATHVKLTEFKDGGYVTRNFVQMDAALTINTAYAGLVCVNKDCADNVVGDNGTIHTGAHPSSAVVLVQGLNKASNVAKFWKDGASCVIDSRVVGTNVESWNTPPVNIIIWDRANDLKYYNMMPQNVAVTASSYFMFECTVKWEYKGE